MVPRIRNLQLISSPGVGGRELVPPLLARQLSALGHPTWLAARPGTLAEQTGRDLGLPVFTTAMKGYADLLPVLKLASFLRREKIRILHAHWSRDLSNCILASGLAGGVPVVLTKHVYATQPKKDIFHAWVYRHTDRVIGVSRLVSENVTQTVPIAAEKVVTIYNGLDLQAHWNPEKVKAADLRSEFGIPAHAPVLGFAGRMNEGKDPGIVLDSFCRLAGRFKTWHLVLVGRAVGESEERYLAALKARALQSGWKKRIHFADYRTDMPEVMRRFDLFACASHFESFGMVVIEAMAMGCAVVGSDAGGIPEIIQPGVTGELFSTGREESLTRCLAKLMADPLLRKRLGREGQKQVRSRFSLEASARQVVQLYETLL